MTDTPTVKNFPHQPSRTPLEPPQITGDYWKPVFFLLESRGFECGLYNAAQVKALPGRPKTDLLTELPGIWAGQNADTFRASSPSVCGSG